MKKLTFTFTILLSALMLKAGAKNIDSLQKRLDTTQNDCTKAELYTNIAADLIQFNGTKTREISYADAGKAIDYVLKAIHINSKYDDILAIRNNYDCLGSAYFIQKKYAQAKWFILQSNHISRYRKDFPAEINALMRLASVKIFIKDYKMAERDFKEAIRLTIFTNEFARRIEIEKCLTTLYVNSGNLKAAAQLEKHTALLEASLEKDVQQLAKVKQAKDQKYLAMLKIKQPKYKKASNITEAKQTAIIEDQHAEDGKTETGNTVLDITAQDK